MILNELFKTNNRWAQNSQPQIIEATIIALGNTSTTYTLRFGNGVESANVDGPSGLSVGNAVSVASYPGKAKKYVILQKVAGGEVSSGITVTV